MHKQFGTIVCIDIEATCWEKGMKPDDQVNEIIEIGLCFLDTFSLTISKPERLLVKPQQSTVSAFCTQLTSLTQQQLDTEGLSFPLACWLLKKSYKTDQYVWASFGAYEQKLFEQQCLDGLALYPFGSWHLNIQLLTGLGMGLLQTPGIQRALHLVKLPSEGSAHRAADDAYNAARILALFLSRMRGSSDLNNASTENE
jgi:inhibitor of KinA sporulation pathway (predicted exonuclease)